MNIYGIYFKSFDRKNKVALCKPAEADVADVSLDIESKDLEKHLENAEFSEKLVALCQKEVIAKNPKLQYFQKFYLEGTYAKLTFGTFESYQPHSVGVKLNITLPS